MAFVRFPRRRLGGALALAAVLGLLGGRAAFADRLAIWRIVHQTCVPAGDKGAPLPKPCLSVDLSKGEAVIKDQRGVAQLLEIPTARVTGIEDPQVLAPEAPPYFADAWRAREKMKLFLPAPPPREALVVTVNSSWARGQDQLHLHIDCIRADVARTLGAYAPHFDAQWRPMTDALNGRKYWARRVDSADLAGVDPFRLLADEMPDAKGAMGTWSLAAAPLLFDGKPGFVLLADQFGLEAGGHAEDLQDLSCALAK